LPFVIFPPRADFPPGDILQCCIYKLTFGEFGKNIRREEKYLLESKIYVGREEER